LALESVSKYVMPQSGWMPISTFTLIKRKFVPKTDKVGDPTTTIKVTSEVMGSTTTSANSSDSDSGSSQEKKELKIGTSIQDMLEKIRKKSPVESVVELGEIINFNFKKSLEQAKGEGEILLPFTKERWKLLDKGDEILVSLGWKRPERKEIVIKRVFHLVITDTEIHENEISCKVADLGVLLEKEDVANYNNMKMSDILADIIKKAGLTPYIDFRGLPDEVTSYSSQSSEAGGGGVGGDAEGPCQRSCRRGDCPLPPSGSGRYVTCRATGPCPFCKSTIIKYNQCPPGCNVNKCAGLGRGDTSQGGANTFPEGTFFCCGCDADFCGCGMVHDYRYSSMLPTSCGGGGSVSGSGQPGSTDTGSGGGASNYWNMIQEVIKKYKYEMVVYVQHDICYVVRIPPFHTCILFAIEGANIIDGSVDIKEGDGPIVTTVKVKTKDGVVYAIDDEMYEKYGELNVVEVSYPLISGDKGKFEARRILRQCQKDSAFSIEFTVIGDPKWYPGSWALFKSPTYGFGDIYFVTSIDVKFSPNEGYIVGVTLGDYLSPKEKAAAAGEGGGAAPSTATIDDIGRAAARFGYCHACSDAACMERTGCGDCWAHSDWLYQKLTAAGVRARIIQYGTSLASNHRSVQIYMNGQWADFPYRNYNINTLFRATASKPGMFVVKGG